METPREISPWSTQKKSAADRVEPDTKNEAQEVMPILLFGPFEFPEAPSRRHPHATDLRVQPESVSAPAPATPPGETEEAAGAAEADPKVQDSDLSPDSSVTSSASSSQSDIETNGNSSGPSEETIPLGTHPSSLSEISESLANAEKEQNQEPLLLP
jgi:hypothetical protein